LSSLTKALEANWRHFCYNIEMKNEIVKRLQDIMNCLGVADDLASGGVVVKIDYPENPDHGDFTTNAALVYAKKLGQSPKALADAVVEGFKKNMPVTIKDVSIAGPGFINFTIKDDVMAKEVLKFVAADLPLTDSTVMGSAVAGGRTSAAKHFSQLKSHEKSGPILVEYTDPNAFKVFHIGHLMSNSIGESLSRLIESSGAKVIRICYPSDQGLHIAKAIWAIQKHLAELPKDSASIQEKTAFLGKMYVEGTRSYGKKDANEIGKDQPVIETEQSKAQVEIDALNKVLYEKSDPEVNKIYEKGRKWSLDHFNELYVTLGTDFDDTIYESDMAPVGLAIVQKFLKKGVFEESQGAIVFNGEKAGLHTRVFVNSKGIATYEAKDVALNVTKFEKYPDTVQSIIITASEQNEYFKVLLKVLSLIDEKNGAKTKHIGHGMMRFAAGKMSSRTGNVVTADSLIGDIKEMVMKRIATRGFDSVEAEEVATIIAIGAIKYSILRSSIGSDIVFDSAASISFEGDSGPYLQYSVVRASAVLEKAGISAGLENHSALPDKVGLLEKLLARFPDVVERARVEYAPQVVANYLINLAGAFNSFYASQTIIDEKDPLSPYRLALTRGFKNIMTEGLWLLGIRVPKKM